MTMESVINVSVVETKSGKPSMRLVLDDGSQKAIHSMYDPEQEAKHLADSFIYNGKGIIVVLGLGLGYHIAELVKRFPESNIIVIEHSAQIYNIAKIHGAVRELSNKVMFIVGDPPGEVVRNISRLQVSQEMPPISLCTLSSAVSALPDYYIPILNSLKNSISVKLWERLRYQKFKTDRLKIALIDSDYFLTREIENGIKVAEHDVFRIPVKKGDDGEKIVARLINTIVDFRPDFFLTINHLGFDEDGVLSSFLRSIEMPAASWYVDSPDLVVKEFTANVSPWVSIFLWDRGYIKGMEDAGFESVSYLPLATDEEVFRPIRLAARDIKRFSCDVGFVGNSMTEPFREKLDKVTAGFHPLVEKLARILVGSRISFQESLNKLEKRELDKIEGLPARDRLNFEAAVLWKATMEYRLSCIKRLKGFNVSIHGDKGWNTLLGEGYRLGHPLNYYKELPLFYNACRVSFNATNLQMGNAVNQRVFDVPACGGFLITDHQDAIGELFEVGKEVITYKDREEISDLVRFYLHNEKERADVAGMGRKRVLKEHTYRHRIKKMVQMMKERYS